MRIDISETTAKLAELQRKMGIDVEPEPAQCDVCGETIDDVYKPHVDVIDLVLCDDCSLV